MRLHIIMHVNTCLTHAGHCLCKQGSQGSPFQEIILVLSDNMLLSYVNHSTYIISQLLYRQKQCWLSLTHARKHTLQARYDVRTNPEPILSVQGRTNFERILNHNRTVAEPILMICSATVRSWFTYAHTHPFTFWFSRTDPE